MTQSHHHYRNAAVTAACAIAALLSGGTARADSAVFGTTNATDIDAPVTLTMNGDRFANQGLIGTGRLSAKTTDFLGTSLGSFSGMATARNSWRRDGAGYAGTLYSLPDRGYNSGDLFSDYQGRLVEFDLRFTPYSGPDLPAATRSQSQIVFTPTGRGIALTDFNGQATTGLDPAAGTVTQGGSPLPSPADGPGAGRVTIDAEAVSFLADGRFYVGDEYTAGIYLFDPQGRMTGFISPPAALLPVTDGATNYNSVAAPDTGRRNNQGMEAVAVTPDGKKLVAILQSATIQDGAGNASNRNNTRILVYDIESDPTPTAPVEHYALQLPILDDKGAGGTPNKVAAQSEVLALNDHQFLVLARDSAGFGTGSTIPLVFKSILLVDTAGATNLAGTAYETSTMPISNGKILDPAITPVQSGELVNLLNTTQLRRFGLDLNTAVGGGTNLTLSEKWEAMALMPALDEARPQDFILFVGNDNDFLTTDGVMPGYTYDAGLNNDNVLLAYRLTLPTAVDPLFAAALERLGPLAMAVTDQTVFAVAEQGARTIATHLSVLRSAALGTLPSRAKAGADRRRVSVWVDGLYHRSDIESDAVTADADRMAGTVGLDIRVGPGFTVGAAVGAQTGRNDPESGFETAYDAFALSVYAQYLRDGLSLGAAYNFVPVSFDKIVRPGAYGLAGRGETDARAHVLSGEIAYHFSLGEVSAGPLASLTYVHAQIDGYTERGAAGGNIVYPDRDGDRTVATFGAEAVLPLETVVMTGRASYNLLLDSNDQSADLGLASVVGGGVTRVAVPADESDSITLGLRAQGSFPGGMLGWYLGYDLDVGLDGGSASTVGSGVRVSF